MKSAWWWLLFYAGMLALFAQSTYESPNPLKMIHKIYIDKLPNNLSIPAG
jgi:hypothetical protein